MAEGARLESVYVGNCIEGSNPSLSAILKVIYKQRAWRWVRSHAMEPVRIGSDRERSSPKDSGPGARCPGPSAGSLHSHGGAGC